MTAHVINTFFKVLNGMFDRIHITEMNINEINCPKNPVGKKIMTININVIRILTAGLRRCQKELRVFSLSNLLNMTTSSDYFVEAQREFCTITWF